jgi:hypothetical protein
MDAVEMKYYLAGRMKGIESDEYRKIFAYYADMLRREGHSVFNPAASNLEGWSEPEIFAYVLAWLCREADAIGIMPGYEDSLGAMAELAVAKRLGKTIRML